MMEDLKIFSKKETTRENEKHKLTYEHRLIDHVHVQ